MRSLCPGTWPKELDQFGRVDVWHSCRLNDGHAGPCRCGGKDCTATLAVGRD